MVQFAANIVANIVANLVVNLVGCLCVRTNDNVRDNVRDNGNGARAERPLLTAQRVAEEVCAAVPHRQLVFTIPKRLRLHPRFDRRLLGALARAAWEGVRAEKAKKVDEGWWA